MTLKQKTSWTRSRRTTKSYHYRWPECEDYVPCWHKFLCDRVRKRWSDDIAFGLSSGAKYFKNRRRWWISRRAVVQTSVLHYHKNSRLGREAWNSCVNSMHFDYRPSCLLTAIHHPVWSNDMTCWWHAVKVQVNVKEVRCDDRETSHKDLTFTNVRDRAPN